ncbi:GNAT family N-acetyltransferase [Lentzea sp. NEAU-D7]|uniref:GNAT family N-acetyltransferase n=1 Tax=Lentzea sp. NEAU-D7 TaxID=2994667 RepID=UPI00224B7D89|nr:GNAT family N-acetyltransferase [Lentzea sp. NEAU-D7]MCX2950535.1 GNAT family N-acetyltransferase [Lentzea sp. NEAU-D7]
MTVLDEAVRALREWQHDDQPFQLHPGDLGWYRRFGDEAAAAAVRTWRRDGRIVAVGLLDGADLLRFTIAPELRADESLALRLADDIGTPERGVLPAGTVYVESPRGTRFQELMFERGWRSDEPWTPLRRGLGEPVADPGVRIEVIGPDRAEVHAGVIRASFEKSTFTEERWHAMAAGSPYADARSLVAFDGDHAVAAVTVWSAGPGTPGLIEPMGVHHDHRGRGFGRAITLAAASALRDLGSSSALVCTPSSNTGAVATYRAAGFDQLPEVHDQRR